jgi:hypothetical protein
METIEKVRVFNAVILLDYPGDASCHYASMVERQEKTIETRMKDMIPEGDVVICCSNGSMTKNRGLALCIVRAGKGRAMTKDDESKAKIECIPKRIAYDLSDYRYFSRKFEFSKHKVSGTFQAKFQIRIPDNIEIL